MSFKEKGRKIRKANFALERLAQFRNCFGEFRNLRKSKRSHFSRKKAYPHPLPVLWKLEDNFNLKMKVILVKFASLKKLKKVAHLLKDSCEENYYHIPEIIISILI